METQIDDSSAWDGWWESAQDFHRYHPGARHRRRLIMSAIRNFITGRTGRLSLLDVGCGDGLLLKEIDRSFPSIFSLHGVDSTPRTITLAGHLNPSMTFNLLDIEAASFDTVFDVVICAEVIEHLAERLKAFKHLAKMVAPGGILIVTTPQGPIFPTEIYFGHKTHSSRAEMEALASDSGLKLLKCHEWGWPLYNALKYATNIAPQKALHAFGHCRYGFWKKAVALILYGVNFLNLSMQRKGYQLVGVFTAP